MAYDGSIKIDTKVDTASAEKDIDSLKSLAEKGASAAAVSVAAIGAAAAAGIGAAVKVGMEFESSMSQVAATMGITASEIQSGSKDFTMLSDAAKKCGEETKFSASQAAEGLNYLALAGYDARKATAALPTVLNLAAAGGLDLGYASDMVTDSMSALGLEMDDLNGFVDQMAKTSQKSNTGVGQLGEAILTVGGTAKMLSGGTVELNTQLGILADNGIKGSEGGTALRNVILAMTPTTDKAVNAFKALGVSGYDANGNLRPLNETFADLNKAMSGMSSERKTEFLNAIFNKVDLKSVNALLGTSAERFEELSTQIENSSGAAAKMAETMNDNLKGQITILGSALEGLGIQIYESIDEPMKEAVKGAINAVGEFTASLKDGELSGAISNVGRLLGELINAVVKAASVVLPALIKVLSFTGENLGLVAASIATVTTAVKTWKIIDTVTPMIEKMIKSWQAAAAVVEAYTAAQAAHNAVEATGSSISTLLVMTMSAKSVIVGVLTGKITLATAAHAAWNAVMEMNPIGIVITLVAALAAGITALILIEKKEAKQHQEQLDKINETTDAIKKQSEERKKAREDREETLAQNLVEIENTQRLWNELKNITDENGNVTDANRTRAEYICGELSAALGTEISLVDGQINKYKTLQDEIDNLIAKKKAEIYLESEEAAYKDALLQRGELEAEQAKKAQVLSWQKQQYTQAENDMLLAQELLKEEQEKADKNMAHESLARLQKDLDAKTAKFETESAYLNQYQTAYDENEAALAEYYSTINGYESASTAMMEKDYAKVEEIITSNYPNAFKTAESLVNETVEEQNRILGNQVKNTEIAAEQMRQRYNDGVKGVTEDMVKEAEDTAAKAKEEFAKIGGNIVTETQNTVEQTKTEFAKIGGNIVTETQNTVEQTKTEFANIGTNMVNEGENIASLATPTFAKIGGNIVDGLIQGVEAKKPDFSTTMAGLMHRGTFAAKDAGKIKSPSKVMRDEVGAMMVAGLVKGVDGTGSQFEKSMGNLMESGIDAAKAAADIHSPSRVMRDEVGAMIVAGLTVGIEENAEDATDAFKKLLTELDAEKNLGLISDAEYYDKLKKLRDEYLTVGTKEWTDYTVKLLNYLDEAEETAEKQLEEDTKAAQKAAEEARDNEFAALKKQLDRGEVTQEGYYNRLAKLRDEYFEEGSEEWKDYTYQIVEYQQNLIKDYTDKIDSIINSTKSKLSDYGDLYTKITKTYKGMGENGQDFVITDIQLNNLTEQTQQLKEYADTLEAVKQRGELPDGFFDELKDLSIVDGLEFAKALIDADDEEFNDYLEGYREKTAEIARISTALNADEIQKEKDELTEKLREMYDEVPEDFFECGTDSADEFGNGFIERLPEIFADIRAAFAEGLTAVIPQVVFARSGGGTDGNSYSSTYNFYGSGQTVSQQLAQARAAAVVERLRG